MQRCISIAFVMFVSSPIASLVILFKAPLKISQPGASTVFIPFFFSRSLWTFPLWFLVIFAVNSMCPLQSMLSAGCILSVHCLSKLIFLVLDFRVIRSSYMLTPGLGNVLAQDPRDTLLQRFLFWYLSVGEYRFPSRFNLKISQQALL